jgi:hypothetical protein
VAVDDGLTELRRARGEDAGSNPVGGEDVQLFVVSGGLGLDRVVIGVGYEQPRTGTMGSKILAHRYGDESEKGPWFRRLVRRSEERACRAAQSE